MVLWELRRKDVGRGERIRTSDLSVPNRALYQAEPRPDNLESLHRERRRPQCRRSGQARLIHVPLPRADGVRMTGIPSLGTTGSDATVAARPDRTTLAVGKALQEKKREADALVRLIEAAGASGKGQLVDYRA